jgi:hypothetical protein
VAMPSLAPLKFEGCALWKVFVLFLFVCQRDWLELPAFVGFVPSLFPCCTSAVVGVYGWLRRLVCPGLYFDCHSFEVLWGSNNLCAAWCLDCDSSAYLHDCAHGVLPYPESTCGEQGNQIAYLERSVFFVFWVSIRHLLLCAPGPFDVGL